MERGGLRVTDEQGVIYNLFRDEWQLSADMDVNYMLAAERVNDRCQLALDACSRCSPPRGRPRATPCSAS